MEGRLLLGTACHACALVAETSCEMRDDYLDCALVVSVIGQEHAAFSPSRGDGRLVRDRPIALNVTGQL